MGLYVEMSVWGKGRGTPRDAGLNRRMRVRHAEQ